MFANQKKTSASIRQVSIALAVGAGIAVATPAQAGLLALSPAPVTSVAILARAAAAQGEKLQTFVPSLRATFVDATLHTASTSRANQPSVPAAAARSGDVFGSVAIAFRRLPAVDRLAPALEEMAQTSLLGCAGYNCTGSDRAMMTSLNAMERAPLIEKARAVNARVNAHVRYQRDTENYGVIDYWATPRQILDRGAGDCEDYAILKMALLRELGVPGEEMAVVVLRDESRGLYHAVLALRLAGGRHVILDNMQDAVLADTALPHYLPLYSISSGKGFIHGRRAGSSPVQMSAVPLDKVAPGEGPMSADQGAARF